MGILTQIGIAITMFAIIFYFAAGEQIRKNEKTGEENPRRLILMRHYSGQVIGVAGVLTLISMAVA